MEVQPNESGKGPGEVECTQIIQCPTDRRGYCSRYTEPEQSSESTARYHLSRFFCFALTRKFEGFYCANVSVHDEKNADGKVTALQDESEEGKC